MKNRFLCAVAALALSAALTAWTKQPAQPQPTPTPAVSATADPLSQSLGQVTETAFFHRDKLAALDKRGIKTRVFYVKKQSEDTASYELQFFTGKDKLLLACTGPVSYRANGTFAPTLIMHGCTPNVYDSRLVITFSDRIQIYSTQDLSHIQTIDLSQSGRQYVDTLPYKEGWLCAFVSENGQGFEAISADGRHIEDFIFPQPVFTSPKKGWNRENVINRRPHIVYADPQQENVLCLSEHSLHALANNPSASATLCSLAEATAEKVSVKFRHTRYGEEQTTMYALENKEDSSRYTTLIFKGDMPYKKSAIDRTLFPDSFFDGRINVESWKEDLSSFTMTSTTDKSMVTYYTDSGKADVVPRSIVEKYSLQAKGATSEDGAYSLYNGEYHGGGDASYWKVWLMENATGKMKYIDEIGGMYGGGVGTGFLQNNDVYVYSYDNFKIFDTDIANPQPIWQLTDYFPMGEDPAPGIEYRYLMAARRDPVSKSVLILYFDMPYYSSENYREKYLDLEKDSWQLKSTYHVTLINPDGTIGYTRDTGVHALFDWGIRPVSMYMEGPDILHIYSWSDSHKTIWFEGRLNLTTGVYTSIKDFTAPEN